MTEPYHPHRRRLLAGLAVIGLVPISSAISVQAQTFKPKCQKTEPSGKRAKYTASLKKTTGAAHDYFARVDIRPSRIRQKSLRFDPAITETELYLFIPNSTKPGTTSQPAYNWRKLSFNLPTIHSSSDNTPLKIAYLHITLGNKTLMTKQVDYVVKKDFMDQKTGDIRKKSHISYTDDNQQAGKPALRDWLENSDARGNLKVRVSDSENGTDGLVLTYKRKDIKQAIKQAEAALIDLEKQFDAGQCQQVPASTGCFMTTAACDVIGLTDDCWELQTLRTYRDSWLARQTGGTEDIKRYYLTAPDIIERIGLRDDAGRIWLKLYWQYILPSALLVKFGLNKAARRRYTLMMRHMQSFA